MQRGIGDGEDVAGLWLFVDDGAFAVPDDLFLDLKDAFAFEHHGEDESGGHVTRIVQLDELLEQRLGVFLLDGFHNRRWRFVSALPARDQTGWIGRVRGLFLPAGFAYIG